MSDTFFTPLMNSLSNQKVYCWKVKKKKKKKKKGLEKI